MKGNRSLERGKPGLAQPVSIRAMRADSVKANRLLKTQTDAGGPLEDPPEWFDAELVREWEYVIRTAPRGLLKAADRGLVTGYVVACNLHRRAAMALEPELLTRATNGCPMQSPLIGTVNQQMLMMLRIGAVIGLTPQSRARIDTGKYAELQCGEWGDVELDDSAAAG